MKAKHARIRRLGVGLLAAMLLAAAPVAPSAVAAGGKPAGSTLTLYVQDNKMLYNGADVYRAAQPTVVKAGTTYAAATALAERFGYRATYVSATKEIVMRKGDRELRWKAGRASVVADGATVAITGKPYLEKGSLMVPVRAWAQATGAALSSASGQLTLRWNERPTADFAVGPEEIHAGQTPVVYTSLSENADEIVNERWEGRLDVFPTAGVHVVTRWVQDASGEWSEPFSVTVNVLPPNLPPQAKFETNKTTYKIGEPILVKDLSTDDFDAIVSREWIGWNEREPALFQPGEHTIRLKVRDKQGLAAEYETRIVVTNEVMYTLEQFRQRFTPLGETYPIVGSAVLKLPVVPYTYSDSDRMLLASDSPEKLEREGILFRDTVSGDTRMFVYHEGASAQPLSIYLAVTNPGETDAVLTVGPHGKAGPDGFGTYTGKLAAQRFLDRLASGETQMITVKAGETKLVLPDWGVMPLRQNQVLSANADFHSDAPLTYTVFAVKPTKDPLAALPNLAPLERDGKHIRGTFPGADRYLHVEQTMGEQEERIAIGDPRFDGSLIGIDALTGYAERNWGNFGVVYHLSLKVKANTLIAANARGGVYAGVFRINGTHVMVSNKSVLLDSNSAGVIYRTGANDETLDISFLTALGSNLPMNLLFLPMAEPQS